MFCKGLDIHDAYLCAVPLAQEGLIIIDDSNREGSVVKLCLSDENVIDEIYSAAVLDAGGEAEFWDRIRTSSAPMIFRQGIDHLPDRQVLTVGITTPGVEIYRQDDVLYVTDIFGLFGGPLVNDIPDSIEELRRRATSIVRKLYDLVPAAMKDLSYEEAARFVNWKPEEMPRLVSIEDYSYSFGVHGGVVVCLLGCDDIRVSERALYTEI